MSDDFILTACNAETLLIKTLGFKTDNHQNGDGEVINIMNKKFANRVSVGVIDKPVGISPSHVPNEFTNVDNQHGIILKRKPGTNHYIIYLNDVLENWIEGIGNSLKIQRPYSGNDSEFKKKMKSSNIDDDRSIVNYFNAINDAKPPAFKLIKEFLSGVKKKV